MESVGFTVTLLLYIIVYIALGNLFRAFKIADYSIAETIFSQLLAFGIAGLLLYGEFCMIRHNYVNIVPGLLTVGCQLLAAALWALLAKRMTMLFSKPEKTLIITGVPDTRDFIRKLRKLKYILWVEKVIPYDALGPGVGRSSSTPTRRSSFNEVEGSTRRAEMLWYCMQGRKSLYVTPRLEEIEMQGFGARHLIDTPLMKYEYHSERFWYNLFKRLSDIVVSLLALIVTSPVFLIVSIAIKIEDRGPVFFTQKRCTKNGRIFEIIKFRSNGRRCGAGWERDPVPLGRSAHHARRAGHPQAARRRAAADSERAQGRYGAGRAAAERIEHVEAYTKEIPEFAFRLRVKGGLTGYAQIYGKYNTNPYDKLRLDLQYIEKQSLMLDFKLLLLTIKILFVPESTEGFTAERSAEIGKESREAEKKE